MRLIVLSIIFAWVSVVLGLRSAQGLIRVKGHCEVLTDSSAVDVKPTWSPDGRKIAFVTGRAGVNEIWVMKADGTDPQRLIASSEGEPVGDPAWSPDGDAILFTKTQGANIDIWLYDLATQQTSQLTDSDAIEWMPAWSPDGKQIAFVSDEGGRDAIWLMKADGREKRLLVEGGWDPAWLADGKKIVFSARREGEQGIWVIDLRSRQQTLILKGGRDPHCSPDGTKICAIVRRQDGDELWVVNVDGSNPRKLDAEGSGISSPCWSPDGKAIAYDALRNGNRDVWLAKLKVLRPTVILHSPANGARVEGTVEIVGSAFCDYEGFERCILEVGRGSEPKEWKRVGEPITEPVSKAVIGKWETSGLSGIFTLRLTATDEEGDASSASVIVHIIRPHGVDYLSHSVPGSMFAGEQYTVSVHLKNVGSMTWLPTGRYAVSFSYRWLDTKGEVVVGQGLKTPIQKEVHQGEEIELQAKIQAPPKVGTYVLEGDLLQGDVLWFSEQGCTTLKATVIVSMPYLAEFLSHDTPKEMTPSQIFTVPLLVKNTGALEWSSEGEKTIALSYRWLDSKGGKIDQPALVTLLPEEVPPGGVVELEGRVKAPDVPGTYQLQWDMRLGKDGWFSDFGSPVLSVPVVVRALYAAEFEGHTTPTSMMPGQLYLANLRLRNTGAVSWQPKGKGAVMVSYRWLNERDEIIPVEAVRTELPNEVGTEDSVIVAAQVQAPPQPGNYILEWDLVRGDGSWFSQNGTRPLRVNTIVARPTHAVQFSTSTHPNRLVAGHRYTVEMTLTNKGTLTWAAFGRKAVALSYHWLTPDGREANFAPLKTSLPLDVGLDEQAQVKAQLQAPTKPGQYILRWDLHQEGQGWFSERGAATLNVPVDVIPEYDYLFISHDVPTELVAGQIYTVRVRVQNKSAFDWQPKGQEFVQLNYRWFDAKGKVVRTALPTSLPRLVRQGETIDIVAKLKAPDLPGTYTLKWDMVHQGTLWFEAKGTKPLKLEVTVK